MDKTVWGIHTPEYNDSLFLDNGVIAIGWDELGDLSQIEPSREAFSNKYSEVHPEDTKNSVANRVGVLYRFVHEMKIGDYVVFPSKSNREINIGIVESDYFHNTQGGHYANQRKVRWLKSLPRMKFSQGALYEAGSFITLFVIKNYADEFISVLGSNYNENVTTVDETVAITAEETKENTKDFILRELSRQFKGYDLELFVEDLLKAMGYRTKTSRHGGDHGIDIIAYKDELPPRIIVQVKSIDGDIPEDMVHSLRGTMKEGDYGLFITLTDYKNNAKNYLENTPIIKGINGSELADLVLKYYNDLSEKYQRRIPLQMVYVPVANDDEQDEIVANDV